MVWRNHSMVYRLRSAFWFSSRFRLVVVDGLIPSFGYDDSILRIIMIDATVLSFWRESMQDSIMNLWLSLRTFPSQRWNRRCFSMTFVKPVSLHASWFALTFPLLRQTMFTSRTWTWSQSLTTFVANTNRVQANGLCCSQRRNNTVCASRGVGSTRTWVRIYSSINPNRLSTGR